MATLQELKSQISAANELGVTNITKKGGTISSDATTAEIMAEIDNLPSGGSAPTVVNEVTWNGDTTELEPYELVVEGQVFATFYRVSPNVLPSEFGIEADYSSCICMYAYMADIGTDTNIGPEGVTITSSLIFGNYKSQSMFICAMHDNAQITIEDLVITIPHSGTWFSKDGDTYMSKIAATDARIEYTKASQ